MRRICPPDDKGKRVEIDFSGALSRHPAAIFQRHLLKNEIYIHWSSNESIEIGLARDGARRRCL